MWCKGWLWGWDWRAACGARASCKTGLIVGPVGPGLVVCPEP